MGVQPPAGRSVAVFCLTNDRAARARRLFAVLAYARKLTDDRLDELLRTERHAISSEQRERSWRYVLFARVCVITGARRTTKTHSWKSFGFTGAVAGRL